MPLTIVENALDTSQEPICLYKL